MTPSALAVRLKGLVVIFVITTSRLSVLLSFSISIGLRRGGKAKNSTPRKRMSTSIAMRILFQKDIIYLMKIFDFVL
jgi:hypothetical protein